MYDPVLGQVVNRAQQLLKVELRVSLRDRLYEGLRAGKIGVFELTRKG